MGLKSKVESIFFKAGLTGTLTLLLSLLIFSFNVSADTLVLGIVDNAPPYQYKEGVEWKGIDVEIGKEISKQLGVEIKYEDLPWARIKKYLEEGKEIDGVIAMFYLDKYLKFVDYTEPTITSKVSVFARKDSNIEVSAIDDLKGKSVGVVRGYSYDPRFSHYKEMNKVECDDDKMLIRILEKGRIDVGVAEDKPFWFISKQLGFSDKFKELYTVTEIPICMALSKKSLDSKSKILSERISKIIRELKDKGVIQEIVNKYVQ